MPKINFIQVDEGSFVGWSDLEELARRLDILSRHPRDRDCSEKFLRICQALKRDLLILSGMIKENKVFK